MKQRGIFQHTQSGGVKFEKKREKENLLTPKTSELSVSEQLAAFSNCHGLGGIRPWAAMPSGIGLIRRTESAGPAEAPVQRLRSFRASRQWRNHARGASSICDRPMRVPRLGSGSIASLLPARFGEAKSAPAVPHGEMLFSPR
jgi:hypothetical protein